MIESSHLGKWGRKVTDGYLGVGAGPGKMQQKKDKGAGAGVEEKKKVPIKASKGSYCLLIGQYCITWPRLKGLNSQY